MTELKLTGRTVRASPSLEVLVEEIDGSIDASTARSFENALKQVVDAGHRNVVFVFTNVETINSTGMGALIQCADRIRAAGGEIALVNVSQAVISLFEMLGLLPILPVYTTEDDAIAYLVERATRDKPTAPAAPPEPVTPASVEGAPPPAPEAAAPQFAAPETGATGEAAPETQEEGEEEGEEEHEEEELYPLELACPDCEKELEIGQEGYYRCQGCGCYFVAEADGNVQAVRLDDARVVEARLPGDESMAGGIRKMASALVEGLGYSPEVIGGIDRCLQEVWQWAVRSANGEGQRLFLFLAANHEEMVTGITVPGSGPGDPPGIDELKGLADQVEVARIPKGGHVLRVCIKAGGEGGHE